MNYPEVSRFITPPDVLDDHSNYTVLIVDASEQEVENLSYFCQTGKYHYDIYFYSTDSDDAQWIDRVLPKVDAALVHQSSQVVIADSVIFGETLAVATPLAYFQQYEQSN